MNQPPLKFLHTESLLIELKLVYFRRISTEDLLESLNPEQEGALKTKPDGTMMDGHHRIKVLIERGIDVDKLPREIWERIK
ncbi:MAG: hypothetical protein M3Q99_13840 [Acidobacteriota bacterium]|nr:hypothetical protein [Acidobacteriota bacterium]